jgi:hypothetical protein
MAKKTGGQFNYSTGRVESGRMPKGSLEEPVTFKENQILAAAGRLLRGRNR